MKLTKLKTLTELLDSREAEARVLGIDPEKLNKGVRISSERYERLGVAMAEHKAKNPTEADIGRGLDAMLESSKKMLKQASKLSRPVNAQPVKASVESSVIGKSRQTLWADYLVLKALDPEKSVKFWEENQKELEATQFKVSRVNPTPMPEKTDNKIIIVKTEKKPVGYSIRKL